MKADALLNDQVSPGSRPRPSLSGAEIRLPSNVVTRVSSPGSRPRPSLSGVDRTDQPHRLGGVAGVSAPAFVERLSGGRETAASRSCRRGLGPGLR